MSERPFEPKRVADEESGYAPKRRTYDIVKEA